MAQSFFWYDLETSGISPRESRIMQFAGQRTDMNLQPIGEPVNVLVRLSEDILPDPDAVLLTGITPQATLQEGLTEAEFCKLFFEQVATPDTIFVGYNTVRFDDEFMRFLLYRNFYDAYEWQWKDGRSRWDLLDVVRMTRALRPEGIKWPMQAGKPTNRLELITKLNGLDHEAAHDALSDVTATIAVAQLIKDKQPKLFDYLLSLRGKNDIKKFLAANQTFIYSSGKYSSEVEKTAVVRLLQADDSLALVYDLRFDPTEFLALSPKELVKRWQYTKDENAPTRLPVKVMKFNHCPAVSPAGVLSDEAVQQRLKVDVKTVNVNLAKLTPEFIGNVLKAYELMEGARTEKYAKEEVEAEAALYGGGFFDDADRNLQAVVRAAEPDELGELAEQFNDSRLRELLPHYKARNFAASLTDEERSAWEQYRYHRLMDGGTSSRLAKFMHRLSELAEKTDQNGRYVLEELQLYAESIMPIADID